jgi:hypothetical protein
LAISAKVSPSARLALHFRADGSAGLKGFQVPLLKGFDQVAIPHLWCSWAKASKPIKIKAARTHPDTTFFIMAATPRATARPKMMNPWARLSMRRNPRTACYSRLMVLWLTL